MPGRDVAVIDAASPSTAGVTYQTRLGNILMAMAVDPSSGQVSVVGTDATNEIRFEPNPQRPFPAREHLAVRFRGWCECDH